MLRLRESIACLVLLLAPATLRADDPPPKGEVKKYTFAESKIFPGTTRDYWVYVPQQYDPAKPACVHVHQDGIPFSGTAPATFDALIDKKEMPITIGVFVQPGTVKATSPNAQDRFNRSFEYDGLGDAYARFLLEELLPDVEKQTTSDGRPIKLSKDGNDRSIGGASSGAIAAFTAAWERPDAFRRVFSAIGNLCRPPRRQCLPDPDPQGRAEADPHLPPGRQQADNNSLWRRLVDGQPGDGARPGLRRLRGRTTTGATAATTPSNATAILRRRDAMALERTGRRGDQDGTPARQQLKRHPHPRRGAGQLVGDGYKFS